MTVVPSVIASALPSAVTTTVAAADAAALTLPPWLEVVAIFAGALASALFAVRKKLDLTGVVTIAVVAGLGGGIMRDLLLQDRGHLRARHAAGADRRARGSVHRRLLLPGRKQAPPGHRGRGRRIAGACSA